MTKLSVNVNKIATLRNARGGNTPNLIEATKKCELYGADGITIHPRPDERHITYADVYDLKKVVTTEFNIEGNPKEQKFIDLVLDVKPTQVTLVPDVIGQITSNQGWNTVTHKNYLTQIVTLFKSHGIRTSIFVDAKNEMIEGAKYTGCDRIELYTESYAHQYNIDKTAAVKAYVDAAIKATALNIGINAGHDLSLENLAYFSKNVPNLLEVSIGHALICDSIYLGLEKTIGAYKNCLVK